jgi:histidinol-phosphate aminotransferase
MSLAEQSLSYVRAISPYQPGKPITELAREMGLPVEKIVKLASNENPLGMSPKAKKAVEAAIGGIERYPDQFELIAKSRRTLRRGQNQVVLGNGSNDVLDLIARVFLAPGRSAVFAQHAFAVYPLATLSTGAQLISTPAKHYGHDLDAMRAAIRPDTRIVWIANPNNPTGNFLPYPEVRAFLEACRRMSSSSSTRPTTNTCRRPSASIRPPGSRISPTWSSPAPSRRSTASPACASAMRWHRRDRRPDEPRAPAVQRQ